MVTPPPRSRRFALFARYDTQALCPPAAAPGMTAAAAVRAAAIHPAWQALLDWCFDGTGTGASPLLAPGGAPDIGRPFAAAIARGPDRAALAELANALCLHLDGSATLAERPGRAARLAYRLQVKAQDACWWRARRRTDPWDSGWAGTDCAAAARLARFEPRPATLIVAHDAPLNGMHDDRAARLAQAIAQWVGHRAHWRQPVRLLLLREGEAASAGRDRSEGRNLSTSQPRWLSELPALRPVAIFDETGPQLITSPPSMLSD